MFIFLNIITNVILCNCSVALVRYVRTVDFWYWTYNVGSYKNIFPKVLCNIVGNKNVFHSKPFPMIRSYTITRKPRLMPRSSHFEVCSSGLFVAVFQFAKSMCISQLASKIFIQPNTPAIFITIELFCRWKFGRTSYIY